MSIGIRADSILLNRARIPLYVAVGVVAVLIAAGLGWLLAGPAIRPLRRLTEQTRRLGKGSRADGGGARRREAEDLSEAMVGMLSRLAAAQPATTNSLQAAQDFAANAAHELRTPLTAMRADLDTLRIHDLPPRSATRWSATCARAQRRVEAIITALGQLASGQLAQAEDRELIDVDGPARPGGAGEHARRAAGRGRGGGRRRSRHHLGLARRPAAGGGQPGAQRGHARAGDHAIVLAGAPPTATRLTIIVDDNGRGLPADEHEHGARPVRARQHRCAGRFGARAWRWWLSRRRCTAAASSCPTVRSAGCARP